MSPPLWRRRQYPYREILRVSLPLVLGMSATTLMEFTDRIFLSNYSIEAISAASPAGIAAFFFVAFFGGIAGYAGVFIAQYYGSGQHRRIGAILWQSIYCALLAGLICWLIGSYAATSIFSYAGHDFAVQTLEIRYFTILCQGALLHILNHSLSAFFTGQGKTRAVLLITTVGVLINIPLDYALIYGHWGFPELGIAGAGIATVCGWAVNTVLLVLLVFSPVAHRALGVHTDHRFNPALCWRLLRFGVPGSLQFTLDIFAFTVFILLIGRLGTVALAATNIVFAINSLAFMPGMGVSQGIAVLVGQALGRRQPEQASAAVWGSIHLLLVFTLAVDLAFICFPEAILSFFISSDLDAAARQELLASSVLLLRIVAIYLCMDALYMVFSGALKGAGDTRFLMLCVGGCSVIAFMLPVYVSIVWLHASLLAAWIWVLVFVTLLFLLAAWRYRQGRWQKMLVIEPSPSTIGSGQR